MRRTRTVFLASCLVAAAAPTAAQPVLDCGTRSLADAVSRIRGDGLIRFTGVCTGPVVIATDGVTLEGVGGAVIDGAGEDAVTIVGAGRVALSGIEVRNGRNGILGVNGAHVSLTAINVHGNRASGISMQNASSVLVNGVTTAQNMLHGLELQTGSAATVTGELTAADNRVFGINVNGSAISFSEATVTASANALGIQVAANANAFINDSHTVINATNNFSTGLTVVSGAQLFSFGGTINASGNPVVGVSVNSRAGLDLDAASTLNSTGNGEGMRIQQGSVVTVFNTTRFSGAPGSSTINARNNMSDGVRVASGATLTLVNQASLVSTGNGATGLIADNGAGVTLVESTITGNPGGDIQLTFGARADFQTLAFGTVSCDATVLVRGDSGITCPR